MKNKLSKINDTSITVVRTISLTLLDIIGAQKTQNCGFIAKS